MSIVDSIKLTHFVLCLLGLSISIVFPVMYIHKNPTFEIGTLVNDEQIYNPTTFTETVYGDEYCLQNNIDILKNFADNNLWISLSEKEMQQSVVALIGCEAHNLGIPFVIRVVFSDDMEYETKGAYSHSDHMIVINKEALESDGAFNAMICVLHEIRHAYQSSITDILVKLTPEERELNCFSGMDEWYQNSTNYIDSDEDYVDYLTQPIEQDAFSYSNERAHVYIDIINASLSEGNGLCVISEY